MSTSIENILGGRDATLFWSPVDAMKVADDRGALSKRIAAVYPAFEGLRDSLLERRAVALTAVHKPLLDAMVRLGLASESSGRWFASDNDARRYLSGGWLEEYVALAVREVGADEVLTGQKVSWRAASFLGENEIDVLARFGDRLFFCSCKALKSNLLADDVRTRERLMDALHEADNLADHFATDGGIVALAVTTDLVDERARTVRYQQLHGKAIVLGVNLITLEHLPWPNLLKRLKSIVSVTAP